MVRIAQIGAGRMGSVHARNAAENPRLDLAYLVDPQAGAAQALATETGAKVASLDQVLNDPTVRGVVVASSTAAHLDNTLACLAAGKTVFCEKPLDLDLASLRVAEAELVKSKASLFVAFNRRFDPHFRALKARIESRAIGELEALQIVNHDPAAPLHPNFMSRYAQAYRSEMDHFADILAGLAVPETGYEASVRSLALAEAAALSVKTGGPVRL